MPSAKSDSQTSAVSRSVRSRKQTGQTKPNRWLLGARLRTLPAAIVPVVVGTAVAGYDNDITWWRVLAALVVALSVQVGTNYANDYSDGVRGTDTKRVGPTRLVASGLASPMAVKRAAFISFAVTAIAGLSLVIAVSPWLLLVGAASILAGWFYTGGKRPYGYSGFGELFVFVFFGLVAVLGSQFVQSEEMTTVGVLAGAAVGSFAVALLVVNNLRDRENDKTSGKRTIAVRIGDQKTRVLYAFCMVFPFALAFATAVEGRGWTLLAVPAFVLAVPLTGRVLRGESGKNLIGVLQQTARLQLIFGLLFAAGLWI